MNKTSAVILRDGKAEKAEEQGKMTSAASVLALSRGERYSRNAQRAVERPKLEFDCGERDLGVITIETMNKNNEIEEVSEGPIKIEKKTRKPKTKSGAV